MDTEVLTAQAAQLASILAAAIADPRDSNCRKFVRDAATGKVVGMLLEIWPCEPANYQYDVELVKLIDEDEARGNHVLKFDVLDASSAQVPERVFLAYPWVGSIYLENRMLPGNPNREHTIESKFPADRLGPLVAYVGKADGTPISPLIVGLGLPDGAHVCTVARYRSKLVPVEPPSPPPPADGSTAELLARTGALCRHLGVPGYGATLNG